MKTYKIEMHKVKAMSHGNGLIQAKIDALVLPVTARDDQPETTLLTPPEQVRDNRRAYIDAWLNATAR